MASDPPAAEFLVAPDPNDPALTKAVDAIDHTGATVPIRVPVERPLTLFLNGQEIVTLMTIGDRPDCLAVGYLLNQGMLGRNDMIERIDVDAELDVVVVRTPARTGFEEKLRKRTLTSGCAQGTAFGDLLERFGQVRLDPAAEVRTSWLYTLSRKINTQPSVYLDRRRHPWLRAVRTGPAAAVHGGCRPAQRDR